MLLRNPPDRESTGTPAGGGGFSAVWALAAAAEPSDLAELPATLPSTPPGTPPTTPPTAAPPPSTPPATPVAVPPATPPLVPASIDPVTARDFAGSALCEA